MKKFLIFLLFLAAIAGAGFFFGWVQFSVPPGSYGVMRSKTHGTDPQVIAQGEFRWCWYKLIPTNVEILVFTPKPVYHAVKSSGSLPSGRLYASFAGMNTGFDWEISGDFTFSIKGEALPNLTQTYNMNGEDDLKTMEDVYIRRLEIFLFHYLIDFGNDERKMEAIFLYGSNNELIREIEAAFPELEHIDCRIQAIQIPDYDLYTALRGLYNEYLVHQNLILEEDAIKNAGSRIDVKLKQDDLEKYGEILTKYPILLQYLALERDLMLNLLSGE